ncbi:MAG: flagellar basal body rod protein FlgC [Thioalkalivibrionaceae bacterium]
MSTDGNLFRVMNTSASALTAQSVRLNTVASNLANANTAATTAEQAYVPKQVVFQAVMDRFQPERADVPVKVAGIVGSNAEPLAFYEPSHPQADEQGYVFRPAISVVEEMANMTSAARSFEANVEVMNTTRQLLLRALALGQN